MYPIAVVALVIVTFPITSSDQAKFLSWPSTCIKRSQNGCFRCSNKYYCSKTSPSSSQLGLGQITQYNFSQPPTTRHRSIDQHGKNWLREVFEFMKSARLGLSGVPVQTSTAIRQAGADKILSTHHEEKQDIGGRWNKSGLWKDKHELVSDQHTRATNYARIYSTQNLRIRYQTISNRNLRNFASGFQRLGVPILYDLWIRGLVYRHASRPNYFYEIRNLSPSEQFHLRAPSDHQLLPLVQTPVKSHKRAFLRDQNRP